MMQVVAVTAHGVKASSDLGTMAERVVMRPSVRRVVKVAGMVEEVVEAVWVVLE